MQEVKASIAMLQPPVEAALGRREEMVSGARPLEGQRIKETASHLHNNWDKLNKLYQDRLRSVYDESPKKAMTFYFEGTGLLLIYLCPFWSAFLSMNMISLLFFFSVLCSFDSLLFWTLVWKSSCMGNEVQYYYFSIFSL